MVASHTRWWQIILSCGKSCNVVASQYLMVACRTSSWKVTQRCGNHANWWQVTLGGGRSHYVVEVAHRDGKSHNVVASHTTRWQVTLGGGKSRYVVACRATGGGKARYMVSGCS